MKGRKVFVIDMMTYGLISVRAVWCSSTIDLALRTALIEMQKAGTLTLLLRLRTAESLLHVALLQGTKHILLI